MEVNDDTAQRKSESLVTRSWFLEKYTNSFLPFTFSYVAADMYLRAERYRHYDCHSAGALP